MSNNTNQEYRDMLLSIYETNLKYFAHGRYKKIDADDLISATYEYFLKKFNTYKHNSLKQLTANMILKIQNLNIDNIRKETAGAEIVEIINPGDAEGLYKEQKIHITKIKRINKQLKKQEKTLVRYFNVIEVYRYSDEVKDEDGGLIKNREKSPEEKVLINQAYNFLNKLDDKCKNLIQSQILEDLKYKEIANKFNMKIGTVMSSLSRCWEKLEKIKELKNA